MSDTVHTSPDWPEKRAALDGSVRAAAAARDIPAFIDACRRRCRDSAAGAEGTATEEIGQPQRRERVMRDWLLSLVLCPAWVAGFVWVNVLIAFRRGGNAALWVRDRI